MSNGSRKIGGSRPGERRGNAGKGRPKGRQNKVTADVKTMLLGALQEVGGQSYLVEQAGSNPSSFLALIGKVIPREIKADITGTLESILTGKPHE